jgi:hypothetical protein
MAKSLYQIFQLQANSAWNSPELLDFFSGPQIIVGKNADSRMEIVFIDDDGQLYRMSQGQSGPPGGSFQSRVPMGASAKKITIGNNLDGRLEVFYTDTNDTLNHFWQEAPNSDVWLTAPFNGQSAKQISLCSNADGRLELFYIGSDNNIYHTWQTSPTSGDWDTSIFRGAAKQLTLFRNSTGCLELIYIGLDNGLYHNWQASPSSATWEGGVAGATAAGFGGFAKSLSVAINLDGRSEFFYIGTDDQIYHNWQTSKGGPWNGGVLFGGTAQQLCLCQNADGRLELFYVGMDGNVYHLWQASLNGSWAGGGSAGFLASFLASTTNIDGRIVVFFMGYDQPPAGVVYDPKFLGSTNCLLSNNCNPLHNVSVFINVTQDIVCQSNDPAPPPNTFVTGFTFQMNCYSPGEELNAWQQYSIGVQNGQIIGEINNYKADRTQVLREGLVLAPAPNGTIPAGYSLKISLVNDVDCNIINVSFQVFNGQQLLASASPLGINPFFDVAPIVAFELNLVGPGSGESATFSSGAGSITYSAATALTASTVLPPCAEATNIKTAEKGNTAYGSVPAAPTININQGFVVNIGIPPQ